MNGYNLSEKQVRSSSNSKISIFWLELLVKFWNVRLHALISNVYRRSSCMEIHTSIWGWTTKRLQFWMKFRRKRFWKTWISGSSTSFGQYVNASAHAKSLKKDRSTSEMEYTQPYWAAHSIWSTLGLKNIASKISLESYPRHLAPSQKGK